MDTKHKLIYLPAAQKDILDIVRFYADRVGPVSAGAIYQKLRAELLRLTEFPLLGPLHSDLELAQKDYRKLVLNQTYVAVYKVMDRQVVVYRVVNGATDYPQLLR